MDSRKTCKEPLNSAGAEDWRRINRNELIEILTPSDEVYMVARVYSLGSHSMGLKLYLDPAPLRAGGELKFEANQYRMTPAY